MFMTPVYADDGLSLEMNGRIVENVQFEVIDTDEGTIEIGSYTENGVNLRYEIFTDLNGIKTGTVYQVDNLSQRSGGEIVEIFSINPQNGEFLFNGKVCSTDFIDEVAKDIVSELYIVDETGETKLQIQPRELYIYEREGEKQIAHSQSDLHSMLVITAASALASAVASVVAVALGRSPIGAQFISFAVSLFIGVATWHMNNNKTTAYFMTRSYLYLNSPTAGRAFLNEYIYYYKDSSRTVWVACDDNPVYTERELSMCLK